ncbi:MAG TPA: hypothetical protein VEX88_09590 [Glaciibacter sp.]|nr:hypothetical protein [Glaciibacter sp.]
MDTVAAGQERRVAAPLPASVEAVLRLGTLEWPKAWIIVVLFIAVHALLAFGDLASVSNLPMTVVAFVCVSLAVIVVTFPSAQSIPRMAAACALVLCGAAATLEYTRPWPAMPSPFAHWHLGAITIVLVVLAVRGRVSCAWAAYAGLLGGTILWAVLHGLTVGDGVGFIIRHAGTLLAGSLFALGRRRTAKSLVAVNQASTARAFNQAEAIAAIEEHESQLAQVNAMARPLLERLARPHDLDDAERAECLQVEASLRDAMRGRSLFVEPVITAARAARARGVEVALLDDRSEATDSEVAAVAAIVAGELDSTASGRFTARLLPEGRDDLATIVVDSETNRMLVVSPDGEVRATIDQPV